MTIGKKRDNFTIEFLPLTQTPLLFCEKKEISLLLLVAVSLSLSLAHLTKVKGESLLLGEVPFLPSAKSLNFGSTPDQLVNMNLSKFMLI